MGEFAFLTGFHVLMLLVGVRVLRTIVGKRSIEKKSSRMLHHNVEAYFWVHNLWVHNVLTSFLGNGITRAF